MYVLNIVAIFNPSSPKEGLQQLPQTVFAQVLKNMPPRGKITPGIFKFILSAHFSVKISNLPPSPGVGQAFKVRVSGGGGGLV